MAVKTQHGFIQKQLINKNYSDMKDLPFSEFEKQLKRDEFEFCMKWTLFTKVIGQQPFFNDLFFAEDDTISEPDNAPSFYNVVEVVQIAEMCGLTALVTVENNNVVIKIS